jgi:LuxR family transcriptional regulator, maltose regulon positive regulatory protein
MTQPRSPTSTVRALRMGTAVALNRIVSPRAHPGMVQRARLAELLDAATTRALTVVTGPAGAGKTTLMSSWLHERSGPETIAWFAVDRTDARPAQFWAGTIDAILAAGERGLNAMRSGELLGGDEFIPAFANAVSRLKAPLVLILDDFQELRAPGVSEQLDALLRHPPDNLRLVIVSRADPRLSLHRLRLEGRLAELRSAELAFTLDETAALFELAELELTAEQLSTLHQRTEGWVAGLRLAALSLQECEDADELIRTFAGDERTVADYLVEEVLQHQSEEVRDFMLRTCVVDLISPDLADALTRRTDGARILERLERSNAFVSCVDEQGPWYRYHGMFRALLGSQLRHRMPEAIAVENRYAARWYAKSGRNVEAARHALQAADWELAATVLSGAWLQLLVRGEAAAVANLIEAFPRRLVPREPELAIAAGGCMLECGEVDQGLEYVALADHSASAVKPSRRADLILGRSIAQLYQGRAAGRFEAVRGVALKLLAGHGSASLALSGRERRALALLNLGIAETWTGTPRRARGAFEDSLALARHAGCRYLEFSALGPLALLEALNGGLRRASELGHEAVALAQRHGWLRLHASASAHCALALCAYHQNALSRAGEYLDAADAAARGSRDRPVLAIADLTRSLVALRYGDVERARRAVSRARQDVADWRIPDRLAGLISAVDAEVLVAAGLGTEALRAAEEARRLGWGDVALVEAKLALSDGDAGRALELTADALASTTRLLRPSTAIELRALSAVASHQRGNDDVALELVEQALSLAEREGYVSPFLSVGAPLRELLVRRIRAGTAHRSLAGQLGEALDPQAAGPSEHRTALLLEPLSDRETAVLRYLPTALSKAEIASELFVSVNTVKTHMKNIYRKLDVTDRSHAVRRARTLHLV